MSISYKSFNEIEVKLSILVIYGEKANKRNLPKMKKKKKKQIKGSWEKQNKWKKKYSSSHAFYRMSCVGKKQIKDNRFIW